MNIIKIGGSTIQTVEDLKSNAGYVKDCYNSNDNFLIIISAFHNLTQLLKEVTMNISTSPNLYNHELNKINSFFNIFYNKNNELLLQYHTNNLKKLLLGVSLLEDFSPKLLDNILSYGDLLSSIIFFQELNLLFPKLSFYDTRELIKTNSNYGKAEVLFEETLVFMKNNLLNKQSVIAGFIGSDLDNNPTTLGFENSNLTAILAAIALNSKKCTFITKTNGIFEIDPETVKSSRIKYINYEKAVLFAKNGLKLITLEQINLAKKYKIQLLYKSVNNQEKTEIGGNSSKFDILVLNFDNKLIIFPKYLDKTINEMLKFQKINKIIINVNDKKIEVTFKKQISKNKLINYYKILKTINQD